MTAARRRLGRGLEALLGPTTTAEATESGELRRVPLDRIRPNPFQPRNAFDQQAISELANSMRASGLLQPIVLRPVGDGTYELIAGERRWRAARQLEWSEIGAVVRDVDDRTLLALALVENLQRDALSPIDEANGYHRLVEDFHATQSEVADLVGRDRSTIANALRLLKLPREVQQMLHDGKMDVGHARALLQLTDSRAVERLARLVVKDGLSVREVEVRARGTRTPQRRPRTTRDGRKLSPEARRIEDALRRHLQTDVYVSQRGRGGGRLTINFYSNDDLTRILDLMLGKPFEG
ncbi:MAG: ParB/RepB/Spo0J family partition protein [Gemmatimonadota bacterium]|nr:MAG: ParB/RepB/Spo0J family partition protein [Gemmatimonadota bacterium]